MKRKIIPAILLGAALILAVPILKDNVINTNKLAAAAARSEHTRIKTIEKDCPNFYRLAGKAYIERKIAPGQIYYRKFDKKGRTLGVYANLTNTNFQYGRRKREPINEIKPSGWTKNKQVTLHFLDGTTYHGWFYNRSHLLAHSLGGADADYNMITGTRPQNVGKNNGQGGMQYTEMKASHYLVKHKRGRVYYSAVPNYVGAELVPRTVTVNIKSDDGSIDQCVIVYNIAPGYIINYATGSFKS